MRKNPLGQYRSTIGKHHEKSYKDLLQIFQSNSENQDNFKGFELSDVSKILPFEQGFQKSSYVSTEMFHAMGYLMHQIAHGRNVSKNWIILISLSLVLANFPNKVNALYDNVTQNNEGIDLSEQGKLGDGIIFHEELFDMYEGIENRVANVTTEKISATNKSVEPSQSQEHPKLIIPKEFIRNRISASDKAKKKL